MKRFLISMAAVAAISWMTGICTADPILELPYRKGVKEELKQEGEAIRQIGGEVRAIDSKVDIGIGGRQFSPACPVPSGFDPALMDRFNRHESAIGELQVGQRSLDAKVDSLSGNTDKGFKSLAAQFMANRAMEQVTEPQSSKAQQDLDALKETMGKWLYVAIALVVAGVIALIVWNILHGKGLYRQMIDAMAKKDPTNQKLQDYASKVDSTEDKWKADLIAAIPALAKIASPTPLPAQVATLSTTPATSDATHAAVTGALVTAAVQTALATPAPSQVAAPASVQVAQSPATPATPSVPATAPVAPATPPTH